MITLFPAIVSTISPTFISTSHALEGFAFVPVFAPFVVSFDDLGLWNALVQDLAAEHCVCEIDGVLGRTGDPVIDIFVSDDASFVYHAALLDVSNNTKFFCESQDFFVREM